MVDDLPAGSYDCLYAPAKKHECDLPDSDKFAFDTVISCPDCGRWYYCVYGDWGSQWYKVYWFNWLVKKRVRRFQRQYHAVEVRRKPVELEHDIYVD